MGIRFITEVVKDRVGESNLPLQNMYPRPPQSSAGELEALGVLREGQQRSGPGGISGGRSNVNFGDNSTGDDGGGVERRGSTGDSVDAQARLPPSQPPAPPPAALPTLGVPPSPLASLAARMARHLQDVGRESPGRCPVLQEALQKDAPLPFVETGGGRGGAGGGRGTNARGLFPSSPSPSPDPSPSPPPPPGCGQRRDPLEVLERVDEGVVSALPEEMRKRVGELQGGLMQVGMALHDCRVTARQLRKVRIIDTLFRPWSAQLPASCPPHLPFFP